MRSITIAGQAASIEKHGTKTVVTCTAMLPNQEQSIEFKAWMFGKRAEGVEVGGYYLFDGDLRVDEDLSSSLIVDSASAAPCSEMVFCNVAVSSRLTKDIEIKYFERATLTTSGMVINHAKGGQPLWLKLNFWGVMGERIDQYFRKGDPIEIVGTLKLDRRDLQGETRSTWTLVGRSWSFPIPAPKESQAKKEPEYSDDF